MTHPPPPGTADAIPSGIFRNDPAGIGVLIEPPSPDSLPPNFLRSPPYTRPDLPMPGRSHQATTGHPRRDLAVVLAFMPGFLEDFAISASLRFMTATSSTSQSMSWRSA